RFLGHRDDVPGLLATAECALLASDYEGCPLAVVEAMAAGVAVAATDAGGTGELVRAGETGMLSAKNDAEGLADALEQVLAQAARASSTPQANIASLRICTGCPQSGGDLSRYGYVILNSWDAPMLPALKAANPGLKALVYKNLSFTVAGACSGGVDQPRLPAGV